MTADGPDAGRGGVGAREYHERTKHHPGRLGGGRMDWDIKPREYKAYVDVPREPLAERVRPPQVPTLAALGWPPADPADPATRTGVDRDALTQLCYYAAGVTKRVAFPRRTKLYRAAACTGALYHVDLYPVVGAEGPVPAGVYHFDPMTLSLDVLREGDYRGALAAAAGGDERVRAAPVTFVANSTWWRNAWKYGTRTYRHAFWDSGTVLANLATVARALDLPARVVTGFADERVADLLGVGTDHEAPLELVAVGADSPAPDSPEVEPIAPGTEPLSPREEEYPLVHEAYVGSSLPDGGTAREWRQRDTGGGVGLRGPGEGERVALDPVEDERASKAPPHVTIPRRGSCRAYDRDALNVRKVSTVFDRAFGGTGVDVLAGGADARPLQLNDCYLVVNGVEGVEPGAYQYHPGAGDLELLRTGSFREEAGHLALDQDLGADAAVCVYFLADLDAVVDRLGDRGYRAAQLEAALTAGRLYLATYAHRDLGGTGLTFYDDVVTDFFAPRAEGQTPTFLYTLGRPA